MMVGALWIPVSCSGGDGGLASAVEKATTLGADWECWRGGCRRVKRSASDVNEMAGETRLWLWTRPTCCREQVAKTDAVPKSIVLNNGSDRDSE